MAEEKHPAYVVYLCLHWNPILLDTIIRAIDTIRFNLLSIEVTYILISNAEEMTKKKGEKDNKVKSSQVELESDV